MSPERLLEHAENVRRAMQTERKLDRLKDKVESGHVHLAPFRDRLESSLGRQA